jgi:hypothetical protein
MHNIDTFSDMKAAVESASGGKNTIIFDDLGMPSIMHKVDQENSTNLLSTASISRIHPGFKVSNAEYTKAYISQFQNYVVNERAYSLPLREPRTYVNFDQAVNYCRNKGAGWGLAPNSLWAAIALRCRATDFLPHGNNQYGHAIEDASEVGSPTYCNLNNANQVYRTATGSGPETWYDDGTIDGISDLNGNVWEWVGGLRVKGGEIQIIKDADCMDHSVSLAAGSSAWMALDANGNLVTPGSAGTLKFDYVNNKWTIGTGISSATASKGHNIEALVNSLTVTPQILLELGILPENGNEYGGDYIYVNNAAGNEYVAARGGNFAGGTNAGVFALTLHHGRDYSAGGIGFRSCFYE